MYTLSAVQAKASERLNCAYSDGRGLLIFAPCGFGKTLVMLDFIGQRVKESLNGNFRCVVVAPKNVQSVWSEEIEKFGFTFADKVQIITYAGYKKLPKKADMIIFDEITKIKNHKTACFKAFRRYLTLNLDIVTYGLTATPVAEDFGSLWSYCFLVDRGEALGSSKYYFDRTYAQFSGYEQHTVTYNDNSQRAILKKIEDMIYVPDMDEVKLDDNIKHQVISAGFKVPQSIREAYLSLVNEYGLRLSNEYDDYNSYDSSNYISCDTAAATMFKIHQLSGGGVYDDNGVAHMFDSTKADEMMEIFTYHPETSCYVIVYSYKFEFELLKSKLSHKSIGTINSKMRPSDVAETLRLYNSGKYDILLLNSRSTSHGLNLQYGSNVMIWYSLTYSYEQYAQMSCRLVRKGQTKKVFIYVLYSDLDVESKIFKALRAKKGRLTDFYEKVALQQEV